MSLTLVFMGSPAFAVPTLRALHKHFHVAAVLTQADKPKGRGLKLVQTPVKETALGLGLPVESPGRLSDPETIQMIRSWKPDAIVVAAFGKILPEEILTLPRLGCVNLHASLLPKYRGASPISAAILSGDRVTGVCTMLMDRGMDTGALLMAQEVPILDEDTAGTLHDRLMEPGAGLVVETLKKVERNEIRPMPQNHEKATYTKPLTKADGKLHWHHPAQNLARQVRAMSPWPAAYFDLDGTQVKVWEACPQEGLGEPGRIAGFGSAGVLVGTGDGLLVLRRVQAPSKKPVGALELARQRGWKDGDCLG